MIYISAVKALLAVKRSLIDPMDQLISWSKGDPCKDNWIGVVCSGGAVGNLRVKEMYVSPALYPLPLCCIFLLS